LESSRIDDIECECVVAVVVNEAAPKGGRVVETAAASIDRAALAKKKKKWRRSCPSELQTPDLEDQRMNLFGRKKTAATTAAAQDPAQTILQLRNTVDTLEKRQVHLDKKIEQQMTEAKAKMQKKDKRGALYCLKRKKMYEAEIEKINGARLTLEQQMIAIEGTVTNSETIKAMTAGKEAMANARGNATADDVGELMDDITDEVEQANDIAAAISAPANQILDDEDLLNELNELEELELESQLLDAPAVPAAAHDDLVDLPAVPTAAVELAQPVAVEDADTKALRELEAAMAL